MISQNMSFYEIVIGKRQGYDGDKEWTYSDLKEVMCDVIEYTCINGLTLIGRSYPDNNGHHIPYQEECVKICIESLSKDDILALVKKLGTKLKQNRLYVFDNDQTHIFIQEEGDYLIKSGKRMQKYVSILINHDSKRNKDNIIRDITNVQSLRYGKIQLPVMIHKGFEKILIEFNWYSNSYPEKYEPLTMNEFETIVDLYISAI
jgi:hypothetical protein